jgi:hypothetical protein
MSQEKNKKPVKSFQSGPVSGAVWQNSIQTENGTKTVNNITFHRSYKDPETGQWKNTESFTPATLGNLIVTIIQAIVFCGPENNSDNPA